MILILRTFFKKIGQLMLYRVLWRVGLILIFCQAAGASAVPYWSENVFTYIEQLYGTDALKRFRFLHTMLQKNQQLPVQEKLKLVNKTMNELPWIADRDHWQKKDYWATPLETIATFGGDCEDIAIAKWVLLNYLGISSNHLRLAYVVVRRSGESHMVLLYLDRPELPFAKQSILVLDSLVQNVQKAPQRKDLLAVYLTDVHGNMVVIKDDGQKRRVQGGPKQRKMRKLEALKQKITENRKLMQRLNQGQAVLP